MPVRWILDDGRRRPAYVAATTPGYYDLGRLSGTYDLVPAAPVFDVFPREDVREW